MSMPEGQQGAGQGDQLRIGREEVLKVVGMHCATCVQTVSRAALSVGGVREADVNLATGEARVRLEGARLKDVVNAIRKAGYDVATQRVTLKVSISEEEAGRLRELVESMPGVISVSVIPVNGVVIAEVNPVSADAGSIVEGLRKAGYRAELVSESSISLGRGEYVPLLRSLALAAPLAAASAILSSLGSALASTIVAVPAVLYAGLRFHAGALRAARNRTTNMDTLVSASSLALLAYSLYSSAVGGPTFADAAAMLIAFVLLGKTIEAYIKERVAEDVPKLVDTRARVLRDGRVEVRSSRELSPGDVVLVGPGDLVPADGVVDSGEIYVDESIYTGEPGPVRKSKGDAVVGGSAVLEGSAQVYVTRGLRRSYIYQVVEAVRLAQAARLPIEGLVDRVSQVFVPLVFAASAATFLVWLLAAHAAPRTAGLLAIAVLAAACPCALGLATPMAVVVAVRRLARRGVVVKDGASLERLRKVRTVVFDKTGTLTEGRVRVVQSGELVAGGVELAAAAESMSSHPVARAIASLASRGHRVEDFNEFTGQGVYAKVDGHEVIVGRPDFVRDNCGGAVEGDVVACVDGRPAAWFRLADPVRPEAKEVVSWLKEAGVDVVIATGDPGSAADQVAQELGVKVFKGLSPDEKAELVRRLRARGPVAFVGDGVNDAIAMKEADVGVAIRGGSDIAGLAGDVVVPSVASLRDLFRESSTAVRKIKENLAWAFAYNAVLIPIAAGLLYPRLYLPPQYAALAMSFDSVAVALWSLVPL